MRNSRSVLICGSESIILKLEPTFLVYKAGDCALLLPYEHPYMFQLNFHKWIKAGNCGVEISVLHLLKAVWRHPLLFKHCH